MKKKHWKKQILCLLLAAALLAEQAGFSQTAEASETVDETSAAEEAGGSSAEGDSAEDEAEESGDVTSKSDTSVEADESDSDAADGDSAEDSDSDEDSSNSSAQSETETNDTGDDAEDSNENEDPDVSVLVDSTGTFGDLTWTFSRTDWSLTISGTGDMDECEDYSDYPWSYYRSWIDSIVIEEGVTSIAPMAFYFTDAQEVTISESVTTIGEKAFYSADQLTSLTLPAGVTTIGEKAFYYCSALSSVEIQGDLTSVGEYAFYYCKALESVTFSGDAGEVGAYAFYYCSALSSVAISGDVTSIGKYAFRYCNALETVTFGGGVGEIGDYAFYNCTSLTEIRILADLTSIGERAFYSCESLTSVTLPEGLETIGSYAFAYCDNVTGITLPDGLKTIKACAFRACDSLTEITIPGSVVTIGKSVFLWSGSLSSVEIEDGEDGRTLGASAFGYCESLKTVSIGTGFTSIEEETFEYCTSLETIVLPDTVTSIGEDAFCGCEALKGINMPTSLTEIGKSAFYKCESLEEIDFPEELLTIGDYAFYGCTALTRVQFPDTLTTIGKKAFCDCEALMEISIPDSVTYIGYNAFYGCALQTIEIGSGVSTMGDGVFSGSKELESISVSDDNAYYTSQEGILFDKNMTELILCPAGTTLTSYTVPDGVERIGEGAFSYCTNLQSVVLPDTVEEIGEEAFYSSGLITIDLGDALEVIGWEAFYDTPLTAIEFPDSLTSIGGFAFEDCESLTVVELGANVSDIGNAIFRSCTGLETITVSADNTSFMAEDGVLFNDTQTILLQYPCGKTDETYEVPDSVVKIGYWAFSGSAYLKELDAGESTVETEACAFSSCPLLEKVTFGAAFTNGGFMTVTNCPALTEIYFSGDALIWTPYKTETEEISEMINDNGAITIYYPEGNDTWTSDYRTQVEDGIAAANEAYGTSASVSWATWIAPGSEPIDVSDLTVTLSKTSYTYDGTKKVPSVTVTSDTTTLLEGTNYTLEYADNVNAGTASVTVTGLGIYTGSVTKTFTINKASQSLSASLAASTIKVNKTTRVSASGTGTVTYKSSNTSVATVSSSGLVKGIAAGTATITVTAAGNDNYKSASTKLTLTVSGTTGTVDVSSLTYSYTNSYSSLGYSSTYKIPLARYKMFYSSTKASAYYASAGYWGGSCFGFATTSGMFNVTGSTLDLSDFSSSASAVSGLKLTDENDDIDLTVLELLEAMQVSQQVSTIQTAKSIYKNDYDAIVALVEAVEDGGSPPVISVRSTESGHALVGYKVEKISSTKTYLYVYDCNYPSKEKYITLTTNSSGEYTGFSYEDYSYSISCIPYYYYQSAWAGRLTHLESSTNSLITDADSFEIRDADGSVLAVMEEGEFTSTSDEIYLTELDDTDSDSSVIILPTDAYTIVDTSDSDEEFELTMVNEDQSAEVSTQADTVEVFVDDSQLANVVTVDAENAEKYEVTITSDLDGQSTDVETVVYSGKCNSEEATVGLSNGELIEDDYSATTAKVDGVRRIFLSSSDEDVSKITLSEDTVSADGDLPTVTLRDSDGIELVEGVDYTLVYTGYDSEGTATVTAFGINDYRGSVSKTYTVTECEEHTYDDGVITKEATANTEGERTYTCTVCGATYTEVIDCIVSEDLIDISDAKVTLSTTSYTYNGSARKPSVKSVVVTVDGEKITLDSSDYTVSYASGRTNAGTYKVTVTPTVDSLYVGTASATFTINKRSISSASLSSTSYTYNGKTKTPSVTVKNSSGTKLTKGTHYTVSYSSTSRKSIGSYTVTIRGTGNYTGTIKKTFTIKPGKVSIKSSTKSSAKKKITVKWSKLSGSVKYQVAYRKKGSSTWKYKTVSASSTSKTLTGLSSGKYYYVKVRAYKKVSGKTYYGSWSSTKKVKVK